MKKIRSRRQKQRSSAGSGIGKVAHASATAPSAGASRTAVGAAFPIVGIGASAGGLEAITQLLKSIPPQTGMAFVVIQHLDRTHESLLSSTLGRASRRTVTIFPALTPTGDEAADLAAIRGHFRAAMGRRVGMYVE